jgi:hypothetical protein
MVISCAIAVHSSRDGDRAAVVCKGARLVTTVAVVVAMWRRQFASDALRAVMAK